MSLAGPASNFMVAAAAGLALRFFPYPSEVYQITLFFLLIMNIGLGLFNLIPLPPLDGSHIAENMLPLKAAMSYRSIGQYGPFILIGIIMLDNFANTGILSRVLIGPMRYLAGLFSGIPF